MAIALLCSGSKYFMPPTVTCTEIEHTFQMIDQHAFDKTQYLFWPSEGPLCNQLTLHGNAQSLQQGLPKQPDSLEIFRVRITYSSLAYIIMLFGEP